MNFAEWFLECVRDIIRYLGNAGAFIWLLYLARHASWLQYHYAPTHEGSTNTTLNYQFITRATCTTRVYNSLIVFLSNDSVLCTLPFRSITLDAALYDGTIHSQTCSKIRELARQEYLDLISRKIFQRSVICWRKQPQQRPKHIWIRDSKLRISFSPGRRRLEVKSPRMTFTLPVALQQARDSP